MSKLRWDEFPGWTIEPQYWESAGHFKFLVVRESDGLAYLQDDFDAVTDFLRGWDLGKRSANAGER